MVGIMNGMVNVNNQKLTGHYIVQKDTIEFHCRYNELTSIDFSLCKDTIKYIDCSHNQLTSLDLSGTNLKHLYCQCNELKDIDTSVLKNLDHFYCGNNKLTSLNISEIRNINVLNCYGNLIETLIVRDLWNLVEISCANNPLKYLDINLSHIKHCNIDINDLLLSTYISRKSIRTLDQIIYKIKPEEEYIVE